MMHSMKAPLFPKPLSSKGSVGFDTKAKRFKDEIDYIFDRGYADPGPGHYNPTDTKFTEEERLRVKKLWKKN